MAFSPDNLKFWVDSREYSRPIQKATYPPFTKGTQAPCSPKARRRRPSCGNGAPPPRWARLHNRERPPMAERAGFAGACLQRPAAPLPQ